MTALLCLIIAPFAQADAAGDEPPLKNQPEHFNGAVGAFKIAARATPTEVQAEDPILFSVRITSTGAVRQPPRRPNLKKFPKFTARFHIEDLPERDTSSVLPGGQAWEFHYHLKPRDAEVTEIPTLRFDYYKPAVARYQADFTRGIPLTVRPRAKAVLVDGRGEPLRPPERMYQLRTGVEVLRREEAFALPKPFVLLLLLSTAPLGCGAWFVVWRRLYPDAARLARLRRSRAAQRALKALRGSCPADSVFRARSAATVVAAYLRQRLELQLASPTPAEVAAHLEGAGLPAASAAPVAEFFRLCDAACFAPDFVPDADLRVEAERLILLLEAEPCLSPL